jgi:hypothetical protein
LINTRHLEFVNAWTAEEWTDEPGGADLPAAPDVDNTEFEALLAGPRGKVFLVRLSGLDNWPEDSALERKEDGHAFEAKCLDLRDNPEVWHQLRNGTVAGRVKLREARNGATARVVPLVNISTLTPNAAAQTTQVAGKGGA